MDIKSGCFFFQFVFLTFSISDAYTKQSGKVSWSAVEISYLCIPTLICLNKSSALDVRPGCWAMLRPGFGLLNQHQYSGESYPWIKSRTGIQAGPRSLLTPILLKNLPTSKVMGYQSRGWRFFFFFFKSWLILRMVWPIDCIPLPPAIGRGHQQKKADRNAGCTFSSLLFSNDCLQRLLLTGQCYLGLYF